MAAAAGDNLLDMAGTAWNVKIMPVHLRSSGSFSSWDAAVGMVWAVDHGADVINYSAGASVLAPVERDACAYADVHGVTAVAAVGNNGPGFGINYPAAFPTVIAVGATNGSGNRAYFSNTGQQIDLVAPGQDVLTFNLARPYYWTEARSGTSFSAPIVTGIVALMLSRNPSLTPDRIQSILSLTVTLDAVYYTEKHANGGSHVVEVHAYDAAGNVGKQQLRLTVDNKSPTATTVPASGFVDVDAQHPYYDAIQHMWTTAIITGYEIGGGLREFRPGEPVLRAQFTKMLDGAAGLRAEETMTSPFTDLGPDDPASLYPHEYVAVAHASGIVAGLTTTSFGPWLNVARAQTITMMVRATSTLSPGALAEPPANWSGTLGDFSTTHTNNARIAEYNGLLAGLVGFGPSWDPWGNASRGKVAQVLWNLMQRL